MYRQRKRGWGEGGGGGGGGSVCCISHIHCYVETSAQTVLLTAWQAVLGF